VNRELPSAKIETPEWRGPYAPYDLVKELAIALVAVALLAIALTVLFSSPDEKPSTIAQWARADPADFLTTATSELSGSSTSAGYGPPYNHNAPGQHVAFIHLQKWLGVSHPIDAAQDFVLKPLATIPADRGLAQTLSAYQAASATQQAAWTDAYTKALPKASVRGGVVQVAPGSYGPVAPMMQSLLTLAQSGGVDGALLTSRQFFQTDYTKPLLFLADGTFLENRAQQQHLLGTQWGMMNETGSYPGQVWLWLYTFWYQIKPFSTSANADALVWMVMAVLSLGFVCIPFIPGLRNIPRWIPIYRLIWRRHYQASAPPPPVPPRDPPVVAQE
jgi:hypothetical protein